MEQISEFVEEKESKESVSSALIRHLAEHAQYEAALLFTKGQYILYQRRSGEVVCKGVSAQALRAAFVEEPVDSGWLPEGVMRWGSGPAGTFIVKFVPAGKQEIRLSTNNPAEPLIIAPPLPALIFAGVNQTYYVWALREKHCDPTAQLYHAPFPNVHFDGNICFGSNRPPTVAWKTFDDAWRLFISSPFNADMVRGKSQTFTDDVRDQLAALAQSHAKSYPVQDLMPYIGGQRLMRTQELRTLNDVVDYYLSKKGDE
jgi:PRTRC genetic system protein B